MSRDVKVSNIHLNSEENALRNTKKGKIIISKYKDRKAVFFIKDNRLEGFDLFDPEKDRTGLIYVGRVQNIDRNNGSVFVEIQKGEICYMSLKEGDLPLVLNRKNDGRILLSDEIIVKIERERIKTKLPFITCNIEYTDDLFVFKTGVKSSTFHYSKKLSEEEKNRFDFSMIQKMLEEFEYPVDLTIRTACREYSNDEILSRLRKSFVKLLTTLRESSHKTLFSCLNQGDIISVSIRNKINSISFGAFDEIIVENNKDHELYTRAFLTSENGVNAEKQPKIRLYDDKDLSLNSLYGLDSKAESILKRQIWLKSGGNIVIDQLEALTVIDVNSAKTEGKQPVDDLNREAASEALRQIRLRNISGIIIIDFINYKDKKQRAEFIEYLKAISKKDPSGICFKDLTALDLAEFTRKKSGPSIKEIYFRSEDRS
ncbi:MAG: ribonuclease E/G [Acetatifactor sp.]|nr:ribonuclease E/G [Acetatifactor sp.]